MIALNMTAYPSVRKPALEAPEPVELEFARDRPRLLVDHAGDDEIEVSGGRACDRESST
jgi:hypothetical protein